MIDRCVDVSNDTPLMRTTMAKELIASYAPSGGALLTTKFANGRTPPRKPVAHVLVDTLLTGADVIKEAHSTPLGEFYSCTMP